MADERYFPFIELVVGKSGKNTENLALQDGGKTIVVKVNSKAGSRHYDKFKLDAISQSVRAASVIEGGEIVGYSFTGAGGKYAWLGDVDAMQAQRSPSISPARSPGWESTNTNGYVEVGQSEGCPIDKIGFGETQTV